MSAFVRIRPAGFEPNSLLASDEMTQLDLNLSKALNAVDGGEWHPTAPIKIGGEGIEVASKAVWATDATAEFRSANMAVFGDAEGYSPALGTCFIGFGGELLVAPSGVARLAAAVDGRDGASLIVAGRSDIPHDAASQPYVYVAGRASIRMVGESRLSLKGKAELSLGEVTDEVAITGHATLEGIIEPKGTGRVVKRTVNLGPEVGDTVDASLADVVTLSASTIGGSCEITDDTSEVEAGYEIVVFGDGYANEKYTLKAPGIIKNRTLPSMGRDYWRIMKVFTGKWIVLEGPVHVSI